MATHELLTTHETVETVDLQRVKAELTERAFEQYALDSENPHIILGVE